MFTKKDLAKKFDVSPSTITNYISNYGAFMRTHKAKNQRYETYDQQAIDVISLVRDLLEKGQTKAQITTALEQEYGEIYEPDSNENQSSATTVQLTDNSPATTGLQPQNHLAKATELMSRTVSTYERTLEQVLKLSEQKDKQIIELMSENTKLKQALKQATGGTVGAFLRALKK